ncbi:hypothetical protein [Gordonia sp. UCD-TK1]|uniref:hypothetical protein n=1 Tax=Gordonia sp. UCD-TK1 TaxID=1857893 RepID=UPI00111291BC|nr:hypothetical protein [Gordonia sp. UCD-TK1]
MIENNRGRPREFTPLQFFTLAFINALEKRPMLFTKIYDTFLGLTENQRRALGMTSLSYDQVAGFAARVKDLVDAQLLDGVDLMNGVFQHTAPDLPVISLAVDSTDYETHARIRAYWNRTSDQAPTSHEIEAEPEADLGASSRRGTWPILRPDNRLQRTADPDARDGHRSARDNKPSGPFVGYDLTLAVNTRLFRSKDTVPGYIAAANLTAAGSHHARAAIGLIETLHNKGQTIADVVADRAYNNAKTEFWTGALRAMGIAPVFDLTLVQRRQRPGPKPGTIIIDGTLFSVALPQRLRELPAYAIGMTTEARATLMSLYDERKPYAFRSMGKAAGGKQRFRGPVRTDSPSKVCCPNNDVSMKNRLTHPVTECDDKDCGCSRSTILADDYMPNIRQRSIYGTTDWNKDYHRRNAVEAANSALRTQFHLDRGYTRVFGRVKNAFLLAFTIFAYNYDCITSHFRSRGLTVPAEYPIVKMAPRKSPAPKDSAKQATITNRSQSPQAANSGPPKRYQHLNAPAPRSAVDRCPEIANPDSTTGNRRICAV